jgi:hypothetical protein
MVFLIAALMLNPNPVVMGYNPPSAEGWEQTVVFRCGGTSLRVSGYGASKPLTGVASITVNDVALEGAAVEALRRDLSKRRAAYRLGARCPRESNSISLFIVSGEKLQAGDVAYWSAVASIRGERLQSYSGLQEAGPDSFWFR